MNKAQIKQIGEVMANLESIVKDTANDPDWNGNIRKNPFYSELVGMRRMLSMMDIPFEYEYNDNLRCSALTIKGMRFEVK